MLFGKHKNLLDLDHNLSMLLGAARGRGTIQSKGMKIEGNATSDSVSVCTHVCSYM